MLSVSAGGNTTTEFVRSMSWFSPSGRLIVLASIASDWRNWISTTRDAPGSSDSGKCNVRGEVGAPGSLWGNSKNSDREFDAYRAAITCQPRDIGHCSSTTDTPSPSHATFTRHRTVASLPAGSTSVTTESDNRGSLDEVLAIAEASGWN